MRRILILILFLMSTGPGWTGDEYIAAWKAALSGCIEYVRTGKLDAIEGWVEISSADVCNNAPWCIEITHTLVLPAYDMQVLVAFASMSGMINQPPAMTCIPAEPIAQAVQVNRALLEFLMEEAKAERLLQVQFEGDDVARFFGCGHDARLFSVFLGRPHPYEIGVHVNFPYTDDPVLDCIPMN